MANTEIDSLSLSISINGLSDRDIKNLESLSESIAKLQRNLRRLELSKLQDIKIPEHVKGLTGVTYDISPIKEELGGFDEAFKDVEESFSSFSDEVTKDVGKINTSVPKINVSAKDTADKVDKILNPKKPKLNKELNKIEKSLKRIKVISFIKLIRGAINSFIRGLGEGIKNLAIFDNEFNKAMSSLATAKTQIFNSLALIISPFITSITPMITMLSNGLANISNTISQISANIKGMSTYTRINTKYMEDYAKSLQKAKGFSFDTFESLDLQDSMFETAEVDEEQLENYQEMYSIIQDIKDTFVYIKDFVSDIVKTLGGFLKDNLGSFKEIVSQSKEFTQVITSIIKLSELTNLFKYLSETLIPHIVGFVGKILSFIEKIGKILAPLIKLILNELLPVLLDLIGTILEPIETLITEAIFPIVVELLDGIVEILLPVLKLITNILKEIDIVLKPINTILNWIVSYAGGYIAGLLKTIFTLLKPILVIIEMLANFVDGINQMIEGIFNMDFDQFMNGFAKAVQSVLLGVIKFLASIVDAILNGVITFINAIIANDAIKKLVSFFGGNWQGITWKSTLADRVPSYANGGMVGELWQMNEKGNPEMLYNPYNNGNTSVINIDQLASAFEQAIYNSGLINAIEDGRDIYIDGKAIAQSRNFKNELNRTNPLLNIK